MILPGQACSKCGSAMVKRNKARRGSKKDKDTHDLPAAVDAGSAGYGRRL